jgi:hypothetical protein
MIPRWLEVGLVVLPLVGGPIQLSCISGEMTGPFRHCGNLGHFSERHNTMVVRPAVDQEQRRRTAAGLCVRKRYVAALESLHMASQHQAQAVPSSLASANHRCACV